MMIKPENLKIINDYLKALYETNDGVEAMNKAVINNSDFFPNSNPNNIIGLKYDSNNDVFLIDMLYLDDETKYSKRCKVSIEYNYKKYKENGDK